MNGRLDQQRYKYVRWSVQIPKWSGEEVAVELARRYFRWSAPATVGQFQWWAGLGARAAKAAVAELKLAGSALVATGLALPVAAGFWQRRS